MKEIKRVLKPEGIIIMLGELPISNRKIIQSSIKVIIKTFYAKFIPKSIQKFMLAKKAPIVS